MYSHEELLIRSFVIKERRSRYLKLITTEKGRIKLRNYIPHFRDFDLNYCIDVNWLQSYSQLFNLLVSENALEECYIISENSKYDMKQNPLANAIEMLFNSGIAYLLSCVPGKLVYYEGEGPNQKILLKHG